MLLMRANVSNVPFLVETEGVGAFTTTLSGFPIDGPAMSDSSYNVYVMQPNGSILNVYANQYIATASKIYGYAGGFVTSMSYFDVVRSKWVALNSEYQKHEIEIINGKLIQRNADFGTGQIYTGIAPPLLGGVEFGTVITGGIGGIVGAGSSPNGQIISTSLLNNLVHYSEQNGFSSDTTLYRTGSLGNWYPVGKVYYVQGVNAVVTDNVTVDTGAVTDGVMSLLQLASSGGIFYDLGLGVGVPYDIYFTNNSNIGNLNTPRIFGRFFDGFAVNGINSDNNGADTHGQLYYTNDFGNYYPIHDVSGNFDFTDTETSGSGIFSAGVTASSSSVAYGYCYISNFGNITKSGKTLPNSVYLVRKTKNTISPQPKQVARCACSSKG